MMIRESVQQAMMEARNLARGIFPVHVDRNGLAAALGDLARMTGSLTGVVIDIKEESEVHLDSPRPPCTSIASPRRPWQMPCATARQNTSTYRCDAAGMILS